MNRFAKLLSFNQRLLKLRDENPWINMGDVAGFPLAGSEDLDPGQDRPIRLYPFLWRGDIHPPGVALPKHGLLLGYPKGKQDPWCVWRCVEHDKGSGDIRAVLWQIDTAPPVSLDRWRRLESWLSEEAP